MTIYGTDYIGVYTDTNTGELIGFGPFATKNEFYAWHDKRREDSPNKFVAVAPWRHVNHDIWVNLP